MGFKAKTPAIPTTPIPVVTETTDAESQADYGQQNNRRKGLLSSILNNPRHAAALPPAAAPAAPAATPNRTLG